MVDITTRSGKGSALTHEEVDANFNNLKTAVETNVTDIADAGGVTVYATINDLPLSGLSAGDLAYVTGTNRLYLSNGTGWYNIALVNQTPTISGNEAIYSLETDGTATTVTLSATDPEGIPITWSATTSGDTSAATVTNVDNVFTITPSTNLSDAGNLTITFKASDGVNIATSNSVFTLGFLSANWKYVSLSVGTVSGNSETNSSFTDSSSNGLTTTAVGKASQGGFHPYLDNWSMLCEAAGGTSGGGLDFGNDSTFALGTGDFTIEYWANLTSNAGPPLDWRANQSNGVYPLLSYNGSQFTYNVNGTTHITSSAQDTYIWHHVAVVRNSGTTTMYINGTSEGSFSDSSNLLVGSARVGLNAFSGGADLDGYISNVRVVKGTAVYTSAFTPTTEKFTAISGTILLTCQDNRFKDNSTNGWTPTVSNSPKISAFSPFGQDSEYTTGGGKGSFHGNGSDAGVDAAHSGELNLSQTAYTIEGRCYLRSFSGGPCLFSQASSNSTHAITADTDGKAFVQYYVSGTNQVLYTSSSVAFNLYAWHHFALVCDGDANNTTRFYVDGVEYLSWTDAYTFSDGATTSDFSIGYYAYNNARYLDGYIADFKVTKSAKYTSAFTPPTSALGNTDAELYLTFDDAGIYDKTGNHGVALFGDTATSTTQTKYADTSIYFDGTGDRLEINPIIFEDNDFTVECWVYLPNVTNRQTIASNWASSGNRWRIQLNNTAGEIHFYDGSASISGTHGMSTNTWHHVAVTKSSGTIRVFVDGTSVASASSSRTLGLSDNPIAIGSLYSSTSSVDQDLLTGYIENLQILNGVAKYTATFTPPSQEQGRSYQEES